MALARYEKFLISNGSTINSIESSLRSLTWFLPGRFKDAELASETLNAFLNLLNLYHDTILSRRIAQLGPKSKLILPPSHHARYTRAWSDKAATYKWAARMLEIVRFVELVVEMGMRRKLSQKNRLRGVVLLELVKALLRLVIIKVTKRPLITPPLPERELDPSTLPPSVAEEALAAPQNDSTSGTPSHLHNNYVAFKQSDQPNPLLLSPPDPSRQYASLVDDYLLPRALSPASVRPPIYLVKHLGTPTEWLSELLFILRPLVYAVLLAVADEGSTLHRPLLASIGMDLTSSWLRRVPPPAQTVERAEYARRDRNLMWYLFRGAIWTSFTKPKLEGVAQRTEGVPLLSLFSGLLREWIPLIEEYHYYTAT
ncbi:peroxisome membrane protein [Auriculariales sp. MPI-PUGE-AT-0066]|nr:peroxisome membrane protein [Auriculariales sp. MPI-PUGE-AT-0066]